MTTIDSPNNSFYYIIEGDIYIFFTSYIIYEDYIRIPIAYIVARPEFNPDIGKLYMKMTYRDAHRDVIRVHYNISTYRLRE